MKYLKLYETKRSEDAITKFKELARADFNTEERFYQTIFMSADLPYDFKEEFKLLYYMYKEFSEDYVEIDKKEKSYMKKQVKKEIQKSLISKMIKNNKLIYELESNRYIQELQNNEWYMFQYLKFIYMSFVTALRNLPPRIRASKKFKI